MNDKDERQLILAEKSIDEFETGVISLNRLVVILDGVRNNVEGLDNNWQVQFGEYWGKLEDANAMTLDQAAHGKVYDYTEFVRSTLINIKSLISTHRSGDAHMTLT